MFCKNCGNEIKENEKFCGKCGKKATNNKKYLIIIIIIFIVICIIGIAISIKEEKVIIPDLRGMTVEEAQKEIEKLDLNLRVSSCGSNQEIIETQQGASGEVRKGEYVNIYVWTKEYNDNEKKENEERNKIESIIERYAEYVRNINEGSVKYSSYTKYGTSEYGEKIYKVKYSTGSAISKDDCFYQYISINESGKVDKSTKLFYFYNGKTSYQNEIEWQIEQLWGKIK